MRERRGRVRSKQRVGVERELARKTGEEVEDAIEIEVSAEFQAVFSVRETDNVDELRALDRRFARAEIVSTELQKPAAGLNSRFSDVAVRLARFAVAPKLKRNSLIIVGVNVEISEPENVVVLATLLPECSSTLSGPPFSLLLPVKFC